MLVVSTFRHATTYMLELTRLSGLYHKLHGSHRPVQMKKAEIKRRKRVVPVNQVPTEYDIQLTASANGVHSHDQASYNDLRAPSYPPTTSSYAPDLSPTHNEDTPMEGMERPQSGPIPVDFTDTYRRSMNLNQRTVENLNSNPTSSRKRSFSATIDDEPYRHAQNMTSPSSESIDPSLPDDSTTSARTAASATSKEARKAELRREAEKMRQMLLAKERELAELGEEG